MLIETIEITHDAVSILGEIYLERRNSVRMAFGKKKVMLRMPVFLSKEKQLIEKEKFVTWVKKTLVKSPKLLEAYGAKQYSHGQEIRVGKNIYTLHLIPHANRQYKARLYQDSIIQIGYHPNSVYSDRMEAIEQLTARVVANHHLLAITNRVHQLNHQFFQKPIKEVRLKYTHSVWGSCSTRGTINLSTRLLFAPDDVIDYVIIHELAHLIEHNHSSRFWNLVEQAYPTYEQAEKWLTENSSLCYF